MRVALLATAVLLPAALHDLRLPTPEAGVAERLDLEATVTEEADGGSAGVSMTAVLRRTVRTLEAGRATRERIVVRDLEATAVVLAADGTFVSEKETVAVPAVFLVSRPDEEKPDDWLALCLRADWDALLRAALPRGEVEGGATWDVSAAVLLEVLGPRGAVLAPGSWGRATLSARRSGPRIDLEAVLRYEARRGGEGRLRVSGRIEGDLDGESVPSLVLEVRARGADGSREKRSVTVVRARESDE